MLRLLWASLLCLSAVLASAAIKDWTDSDLQDFESRPMIADRLYLFYADWCSACRNFKPVFEKKIAEVRSKIPELEVIRVNLDAAPLLSRKFKISHLPTVFHESNGEVRNVNHLRADVAKLFTDKLWKDVKPISLLEKVEDPAVKQEAVRAGSFNLVKWVESKGVSMPAFIMAVSMMAMIVVLFAIWIVWLYTDYKLNGHRLTEEAVKERVRLLRKMENEEFGKDHDSDEEDEDSGNESDSESEASPPRRRQTKRR